MNAGTVNTPRRNSGTTSPKAMPWTIWSIRSTYVWSCKKYTCERIVNTARPKDHSTGPASSVRFPLEAAGVATVRLQRRGRAQLTEEQPTLFKDQEGHQEGDFPSDSSLGVRQRHPCEARGRTWAFGRHSKRLAFVDEHEQGQDDCSSDVVPVKVQKHLQGERAPEASRHGGSSANRWQTADAAGRAPPLAGKLRKGTRVMADSRRTTALTIAGMAVAAAAGVVVYKGAEFLGSLFEKHDARGKLKQAADDVRREKDAKRAEKSATRERELDSLLSTSERRVKRWLKLARVRNGGRLPNPSDLDPRALAADPDPSESALARRYRELVKEGVTVPSESLGVIER
jgi:hypothetical protein